MKVSDFFSKLDALFEVENQEFYDNSGVQLSFPDREVGVVYVALDPTVSTVREAINAGADVLITHHPLFFDRTKALMAHEPDGVASFTAFSAKLSVYSAHTNFDIAEWGLNREVARLIGITDPTRLTPREGYVGNVRRQTLVEYAEFVKKALGESSVRVYGRSNAPISRVAVVNGSGGRSEEMISFALEQGADVFVSAEFKHSVIRYALDKGCAVIDVSHFSSELPFVELAGKIIESEFGIRVIKSQESQLLY